MSTGVFRFPPRIPAQASPLATLSKPLAGPITGRLSPGPMGRVA